MNEPVKHTPAPWVYAPDNPDYRDSPFAVWTEKGPGYGLVAHSNPGGLMPTDPARQAADARLIAAAPDLLAALIRTANMAVNCVPGCTIDDPVITEARAAIAKATGGTI